MHKSEPSDTSGASVLAQLRRLAPARAIHLSEALRVAELQADKLLALQWVSDVPVPLAVLEMQPRIRLEYDFDMPLAVSGASDWDDAGRCWIITINGRQPLTRQRFTTLHEYKHIVDHGRPPMRTNPTRRYWGLPPHEFVADYFAGCALVPRDHLQRAWAHGRHEVAALARQFDVSERAIEVRLEQLGLTPAQGRCGAWLATNGRAA